MSLSMGQGDAGKTICRRGTEAAVLLTVCGGKVEGKVVEVEMNLMLAEPREANDNSVVVDGCKEHEDGLLKVAINVH